jgi:hypothetical protein
VYVAQSGPLTASQQLWTAALWAGVDRPPVDGRASACLGGLTALRVAGLRRIASPGTFVLIDARRSPLLPPPGLIAHRSSAMPDVDTARIYQPPATLPGRSVLDAAQWARSDDEARLIVAASFQQRLVTLVDIERAVALVPTAKRRRLVMRTAWDCDGGSHSLSELDIVSLCRRAGLPIPDRQVRRVDLDGRVRFLDAVWEKYKVALEVEGAHHLLVEVGWDDADRQNAIVFDGYLPIRLPAFVIREKPDKATARIRQALIRQGWRP